MTTAREIMTGGAECVGENETLEQAARKMKDLDVGSLPICGHHLVGMLSQADIARNYPEDRVGELVAFISY
ncbi:CBS domain-containing protein [Arthrobacter globiformis]|uniref:CBS domain-containing protein n=1 Tax=Arthrobacter globiformis TaxID=1665 RepID=UPI002782D6F1|nr:CBS domain-containing protein [Arthrobacter globiformis]MDQ1058203.1 CBS domain-containing protein [Arthrobacter globiformis]